MHGRSSLTRRACAAGATILVVVAALAGGAGTGRAGATLLTVSLNDIGDIGSISAGQKLGYEASVVNSGSSTVSHVRFVLDTALGNASGDFQASAVSGDGSPRCAEDPDAGSRMICTARQLAPGQGFAVNAVFSAPAAIPAGSASLVAQGTASVSAQTNGSPGNNGTSNWFSPQVSTTLLEASALSKRTFSLPDEALTTGVDLETKIDLPAAFLNGHFGLVTQAGQEDGAALCDKCPTVFSNVSIPASLTSSSPFALFVNEVLTSTSPYAFELKLNPSGQTPGYKPSGISHRGDEAGAVFEPVPLCSSVTLGAANPICLDALPSKNKKTGVITATGKGIENGSYGWD
jgi:hypothetical protein